jgi:LacI family transcriptional regulator
MRASLKYIADTLHLSKATVSWILSGQGETKGFSSATIKLVKDYADLIGYRPNLVARSLSMGATHTIGIVIPAVGDTFYSQMTQHVEHQVQQKGYSLIVSISDGDGNKEQNLIKMLRSQQVDGLIIAPSTGDEESIKSMLSDSYPFVLIDRYYPSLRTNYVIVDNERSSKELVTQLIKKGSKKIAILTSDTHLIVMMMRVNGYRSALAQAHISQNESLFLSVNRANYEEDIKVKLDNLFEQNPDVDGFFFATHYLALESIRYFINRGIDYQNRFQMGCFHTTTAIDLLAPNMLFSIMPIGKMCTRAVDILIDDINNKEKQDIKEEIFLNSII